MGAIWRVVHRQTSGEAGAFGSQSGSVALQPFTYDASAVRAPGPPGQVPSFNGNGEHVYIGIAGWSQTDASLGSPASGTIEAAATTSRVSYALRSPVLAPQDNGTRATRIASAAMTRDAGFDRCHT